jgi:hypothetical protein
MPDGDAPGRLNESAVRHSWEILVSAYSLKDRKGWEDDNGV